MNIREYYARAKKQPYRVEPKGEPMVRKEKSVERNYVPLRIPRRGIITVDFALYDRAERYLKEHLGSDNKLRPKAWKAEVAEAETVKKCVEQAIPPTKQKKEKQKGIDMSL